MSLIYIVEDDENIREIEEYALKKAGHDVLPFELAGQLMDQLAERIPDLLVLDVMLPDGDGVEIVSQLRSHSNYRDIPVIMVTAKTREMDIVKGLDSGADDYITKPFSILEFTSRVNSLLRRTHRNDEIMKIDEIVLNASQHKVFSCGEEVVLTNKEYELLQLLMQNQGRVVTRGRILETVWGFDYEGESRTLDMHVRTLRQKLSSQADHIVTVRNVGYAIR